MLKEKEDKEGEAARFLRRGGGATTAARRPDSEHDRWNS